MNAKSRASSRPARGPRQPRTVDRERYRLQRRAWAAWSELLGLQDAVFAAVRRHAPPDLAEAEILRANGASEARDTTLREVSKAMRIAARTIERASQLLPADLALRRTPESILLR